ncbi:MULTISPECIES: hypothetical protein [Janthinobacterium]|uniref:Uncharacterized protein n=1 Tax=Janthinobacterium kumbetense TaxID=2950280 RepID=A0ABT0WMG9_9BURK|nr:MULTISPECIES: hypothetical protein [Janthinobacterium]MCM2564467.1 hypothetical protein [Janthinobacterium kumbetense]MDN2701195.1 hypothetical protein [Janthinobacterium sp. SUN100]
MMFDIKNSKNVVLDDNKNKGADFAKIENVENFSARSNVSEEVQNIDAGGWRKWFSSTLSQLLASLLLLIIIYFVYRYYPEIKNVMT